MYVINPSSLPENRLYRCGRLMASWLINQKSFPLLSRDGKDWIFAKTEVLEEIVKFAPFWLKVKCKF